MELKNKTMNPLKMRAVLKNIQKTKGASIVAAIDPTGIVQVTVRYYDNVHTKKGNDLLETMSRALTEYQSWK